MREDGSVQTLWHKAYTDLQRRLLLYTKQAQWTVCGFSVCVDALTKLSDCVAGLQAGRRKRKH
jgi:hypothetical protein